MNKSIITLIGFLLFLLGSLALVLSLVGIQLTMLTWIDAPGKLFGFIVRLLMIIVGITMVAVVRSDFEGEGFEG
jgi:hypothetical protein